MTEIQFIAEAGQTMGGDVGKAVDMVHAFAAAGATHFKVQMLHPESIAAEEALSYWSTGPKVSQRRQFRENGVIAYHDWDRVRNACAEAGVGFVATPFDLSAVAALGHLDPAAVKIASGDITYLPLIEAVAKLGKPVLLSTGASTLGEINAAMDCAYLAQTRRKSLVLLACTLAYPTPMADANLARIGRLRQERTESVGYSDHTTETITSMLAVCAGATWLEKHVTLGGSQPDDAMGLSPQKFAAYVLRGKEGAKIAGQGDMVVDAELPARVGARRAARFRCDIPAGVTVHPSDITYLRSDPHGDGRSIRRAMAGPFTLRPVSAGEIISDENCRFDQF